MRPNLSMQLPGGLEVVIRNPAEAEQFYKDIFEKHIYDSHGVRLCPGDVVFDVGANIGLFTLYAAGLPGVTVYAFEPAPDTFALLQQNVARHAAAAHCFNVGIGAQAEVRQFTFYPRASGLSSFYGDESEDAASLHAVMSRTLEDGGRYSEENQRELSLSLDGLIAHRLAKQVMECRVETLSEVMRRHGLSRIDLLKVDVQRAELDVLLGIEDEHWPTIRQVVLEVHDTEGRLERIRSLLGARGYRVSLTQDDLYAGSSHYNLYALGPELSRVPPGLADRAELQRRVGARA